MHPIRIQSTIAEVDTMTRERQGNCSMHAERQVVQMEHAPQCVSNRKRWKVASFVLLSARRASHLFVLHNNSTEGSAERGALKSITPHDPKVFTKIFFLFLRFSSRACHSWALLMSSPPPAPSTGTAPALSCSSRSSSDEQESGQNTTWKTRIFKQKDCNRQVEFVKHGKRDARNLDIRSDH